MAETLIFENAQLVLADHVLDGWLALTDGKIAEIGTGRAPERGTDCHGDLLVPGLVELHTDHLERHLRPRPRVVWPVRAAIQAFDAQVSAAGMTTVFDCIRVGHDFDVEMEDSESVRMATAINASQSAGLLRAEHRIHLRCEVCADNVIDEFESVSAASSVHLVSLMDHTPGARQFSDLDAWRTYYGGMSGRTAQQLDDLVRVKREQYDRNYQRHRKTLVVRAREQEIALASHDDATNAHVAESIEDGVSIAEFPTTVDAAQASHKARITVMMGAPNVVRGGSHSGNVAAETLARSGVLDALSSDYVPGSLLPAAFHLADRVDHIDLPSAIRLVTLNPARAAGLNDRGELREGKRGDVVRVKVYDGEPIVREVYRNARRVL
ncbi:MAG: alpha-D-ribose 1-methylphosphonate 5-triphosphate diphosphatase [Pseudomonadota bacterium]